MIILSYAIAIVRLLFWVVILFFSGLQQILFMKSEIANIDLRTIPLWCDRKDIMDNLAYIDKLSIENPELVEAAEDEDIVINEEDDDEEE